MSGLLECKYCGAAAEAAGKGWLAECGSWDFGREWNRSDGCYLRCAWRSQGLELDKLRQQLDAAIRHIAEWCVAIDVNGTGWDDWDEFYKDAMYRENALPDIRALLVDAIEAARKRRGE